ncbi:FxsA family protein [Mycobacterium sherrisii]|uniref:Membrane protein FxsA n=1 Tax=Mycobacterium sherrisii TaxID=243061 RepID=A0A1E3SR59_9MYCO|nr:FxsA family protein [Mycobacterium sherrisii]MCV7028527.1 FxsA family protein [Mycobacterium sherrisii]MEC4765642.1 FxsA family protein [Mycobacterium sherrisii]ODR04083.1 membrane protein FxsA [Mycobacterium sherrisii]ORW71601.1 exclusion suppressor FxsA [Mycobacterium sherrisii]
MVRRMLLVYAVVELAAIFTLVSTIGWGWTLLSLLATFILGWGLLAPIAGSQLLGHLGQVRSGAKPPRSTLGDGATTTVATALVLVPGLVSTVLGVLLLLPPVRAAVGPAVTGFALRGLQRHAPTLVGYPVDVADLRRPRDGRDFIDGEVIDVHDVQPPALSTDDHWGGPRYSA